MRQSMWMEAGSEAWRASCRSPLAFRGVNDGPDGQGDDGESDWDEVQFVGLIERDGFLRTEALEADWE